MVFYETRRPLISWVEVVGLSVEVLTTCGCLGKNLWLYNANISPDDWVVQTLATKANSQSRVRKSVAVKATVCSDGLLISSTVASSHPDVGPQLDVQTRPSAL